MKLLIIAGLTLLGCGGWLAYYGQHTLNPDAAYVAVPLILFGLVAFLGAGVIWIAGFMGT